MGVAPTTFLALPRSARNGFRQGVIPSPSSTIASLWSSEPGPGFAHDDVSDATARVTPAVEVISPAEGPATVAAYTVLYEGAVPQRTLLLCDLPPGARTLVGSDD